MTWMCTTIDKLCGVWHTMNATNYREARIQHNRTTEKIISETPNCVRSRGAAAEVSTHWVQRGDGGEEGRDRGDGSAE